MNTKRTVTPEAEELLGKELKVLDKGFVRLVSYDGSDQDIVKAARCSYEGVDQREHTPEQDAALIDYLVRHKHTSPIEMVTLKFHVKAPLFVIRQWFRHRTASVNELSGRYAELKDEFYIPIESRIQGQSMGNKQASEGDLASDVQEDAVSTIQAVSRTCYINYKDLISDGVSRELARTVLPVNLYSEFYWKQDLHNLLHFLKLRLDEGAQWEIQQYAKALEECVKAVAPIAHSSWSNAIKNALVLTQEECKELSDFITAIINSPYCEESPTEIVFIKNKRKQEEYKQKIKRILECQ